MYSMKAVLKAQIYDAACSVELHHVRNVEISGVLEWLIRDIGSKIILRSPIPMKMGW